MFWGIRDKNTLKIGKFSTKGKEATPAAPSGAAGGKAP
jgi:hypothetical protein